jgi:hypothetical protein
MIYLRRKLSYEFIYKAVLELFQYDKDKTNLWWMAKNPQLKGLSPFEVVKKGKGRRIMQLINRCG